MTPGGGNPISTLHSSLFWWFSSIARRKQVIASFPPTRPDFPHAYWGKPLRVVIGPSTVLTKSISEILRSLVWFGPYFLLSVSPNNLGVASISLDNMFGVKSKLGYRLSHYLSWSRFNFMHCYISLGRTKKERSLLALDTKENRTKTNSRGASSPAWRHSFPSFPRYCL